MKVTEEEVIEACEIYKSAREAARNLGIHTSSFIKRAKHIGCYDIILNKPDKQRIFSVDDRAFEHMNADVAYWLGYIAADGSVVENRLKFCIKRDDEQQLRRFLCFLNSDYSVHYHMTHYLDELGVKKYFEACNISIVSTQIVSDLKRYGIVQGKKYKDINFISYIPDEYKLEFIFGLFDGDGSITFGNSSSITLCSTYSMSYDIVDVLNKNGMNCAVQHRDSIDVIYIRRLFDIEMFYKLYKDRYRLERKLNIFKEYFNQRY